MTKYIRSYVYTLSIIVVSLFILNELLTQSIALYNENKMELTLIFIVLAIPIYHGVILNFDYICTVSYDIISLKEHSGVLLMRNLKNSYYSESYLIELWDFLCDKGYQMSGQASLSQAKITWKMTLGRWIHRNNHVSLQNISVVRKSLMILEFDELQDLGLLVSKDPPKHLIVEWGIFFWKIVKYVFPLLLVYLGKGTVESASLTYEQLQFILMLGIFLYVPLIIAFIRQDMKINKRNLIKQLLPELIEEIIQKRRK